MSSSKGLLCQYCKNTFDSKSRNPKQKCCSRSCSIKLKPRGNTFVKGKPSWNKGLNVSGMSGKTLTEQHKEKIRLANSKESGHKTSLDYRLRKTKKFKEWSKAVIKRDGICVFCEKPSNRLSAHHIVTIKEAPEMVYDLNNGAALCNRCHAVIHNFGNIKKAELINGPT